MPGPILSLELLVPLIRAHADAGQRVVLTNGVFDLLHVGHLRYLRAARDLGDVLVVGINGDASVRALKPGRPLVPEDERAELVAALDPVDYAVVFREGTADQLLVAIRPDIYVKGGDYSAETLPEAAVAREVGASVVFLPLVPDHSTTRLLAMRRGGIPGG